MVERGESKTPKINLFGKIAAQSICLSYARSSF